MFINEERLKPVREWTKEDLKPIHKSALCAAMRNNSLGPSALTAQDKGDLIDIVARARYAKGEEWFREFFSDCEREMRYQSQKKARG